jgi:LysR family transcriptional regulator for bpeEF and oprC
MLDSLTSIALFVRIAETRSFSAAAHQLGISAPAVSKGLARLEQRLGVQLLNRTTRKVSLTDDGRAFLDRCRQILADAQDAEELLTRRRVALSGRLRVQMPVGFGRIVVLPLIPRLLEAYPELAIDIELSDRLVDLADEAIDVALRIGEIPDSRLIAKKIYAIRFVTCTSPAYLARHGTPRTPEELAEHSCLPYWVPRTGRYRPWEFARDGVPFTLQINGHLNINNSEALMDAAVAGAGIVSVSTFLAADALAAGKLRAVLTDFATEGPPVSAVYLPSRQLSPRVRAFLDFVTHIIPARPPWDAVMSRGERRAVAPPRANVPRAPGRGRKSPPESTLVSARKPR